MVRCLCLTHCLSQAFATADIPSFYYTVFIQHSGPQPLRVFLIAPPLTHLAAFSFSGRLLNFGMLKDKPLALFILTLLTL